MGLKGADRACGDGGSPVWLRDGLRLEEADQAIEGLNPEVAILWCEGLKIQRATRQDERERQNVTPLCLVARVRRKKRKKIEKRRSKCFLKKENSVPLPVSLKICVE